MTTFKTFFGFNSVAGAASYTLTATTAALVVAGTTTDLVYGQPNKTLTATTAALALTGIATGLTYSGASTATAFDPAYTQANTTLSNGNLTATRGAASGGTYSTSLTTEIAAAANKVYGEARIDVRNSPVLWGLANTSMSLSAFLGGTNNSISVFSGNVTLNGATLGAIPGPTPAAGDVVATAVDKTAQTIAFRNITQAAAWS